MELNKKLQWFKIVSIDKLSKIIKRSSERIKDHEVLEVVADSSDCECGCYSSKNEKENSINSKENSQTR